MADLVARQRAAEGQVCEGRPNPRFFVLVEGREYEIAVKNITLETGFDRFAIRLEGCIEAEACVAIAKARWF